MVFAASRIGGTNCLMARLKGMAEVSQTTAMQARA
jgi:hypothetical protein